MGLSELLQSTWSNSPLLDPHHLQCSLAQKCSWLPDPLNRGGTCDHDDQWNQGLWLCVSSELPLRGPYTLLLFYPRTMRCLLEQEAPGQKAWLSQLMTFLRACLPQTCKRAQLYEGEHFCEQMCGSGKDQKSHTYGPQTHKQSSLLFQTMELELFVLNTY